MTQSPSLTITAFQLAETLPIKAVRGALAGKLLASGSQELFYGPIAGDEPGQTPGYLYVLNYGVAIYAGHSETYQAETNRLLRHLAENPLEMPLREDYRVRSGAETAEVGYNEVALREANADAIRIVMLYVGQSVALDYYEGVADRLMKAPNAFLESMRLYGRLKASRPEVVKYIGETLSMRNRIIDNLYVLDTPDVAWENEELDRLDRGMKRNFDIVTRFRGLEDQLDVVQGNLELFAEMLQHKQSNLLEWIIIGLICIEVVKLLIESIWR